MHDSRARIWFALFVLAVFCFGGAAGFVVGRHPPPFPGWAGDPVGPEGRGPAGGRNGGPPFGRGFGRAGVPAGIPPPMAARLASELGLDADQRARMQTILEERRRRFEQVHREARDRFETEQRDLQAAIRAILRPDQIERFDRFMSERRP